ncbi:MAG: hypothetical protein JWR63_1838, partial [Conexibacter sp.]|nr:hypothetical protein [Conexibacter sp.]
MPYPRRSHLGAALAALALLTAGCGSSSDDGAKPAAAAPTSTSAAKPA